MAGTPRREENNDWLRNAANTGDTHGVELSQDLAHEIAQSGRWSYAEMLAMLEQDIDEEEIRARAREARLSAISRLVLDPDEERELSRELYTVVAHARQTKRTVIDKFICWCLEEMTEGQDRTPPYVPSRFS